MGEVRNDNDQSAGLMDKVRNGATSQLGVQKATDPELKKGVEAVEKSQ